MRKIVLLLLFGLTGVFSPSFSQLAQAQAVDLAPADAGFLNDAAQAGIAEIAASRLAQRKATRPETRAFAEQMLADHAGLAEALKQLAAQKQVELPTEATALQKAKLAVVEAGDATKFDARYVRAFGVDAHEDAVLLFQQASRNVRDPDVRSFALKNLPMLRQHLEMARRLVAGTAVSAR
ncbi:MAG TPA: DUF4142 domain-containing protein [Burkholderiaceae bacterium]